MSHTPGPWRVEKNRAPNGGSYYRIYDKDEANNVIAQVIGDGRTEYHQNAALIAAAPELLEALKDFVEAITWGKALDPIVSKVNKIISKAEGKE